VNPMDFIPGLVPSGGVNPFEHQTYLPGGYSMMGGGKLNPQQTQMYDQWFNNIGRWLTPGQHPTKISGGPARPSGPTNVPPTAAPPTGAPPVPNAPTAPPPTPVPPGGLSTGMPAPGYASFMYQPNVSVPQGGMQPNYLSGGFEEGVQSMGPPSGFALSPLGAHRPLVANPTRRGIAQERQPEAWDARMRGRR
jgi:hypothetical protein